VPAVVVAQLVALAVFLPSALAALVRWQVILAASLVVASSLVLLRHYLHPVQEGAPYEERWRHLFPFVFSGYGVTHKRGVVFDPVHKLKLDVFAPEDTAIPAAAIIYVHGGGWFLGYRGFQGLPFMIRMAQRGFVCFTVDYRLSPRATFPDHVVDVKRAIAWVRANAESYNVDPERILIAGNSAGGHLASLCALTPNLQTLQPGFEAARTDVMACLSFYGIYDLLDALAPWPHRGLEILWRWLVIKKPREQAEALWKLASPAAHIGAHAPPFFLAHGTHDTLVPIEQARAFAARLSTVARVELAEIKGAQHAFELGISPRSRSAVQLAERFALSVIDEHAERVHTFAFRSRA
jgi:acetyl esterase/lipase